MTSESIVHFLTEGDDEDSVKDMLGWGAPGPDWDDPAQSDTLYDEQGRKIASSRNLRGIRTWVRQYPVQTVEIRKLENQQRWDGAMLVRFVNGMYSMSFWASFSMIKWALRNWRNLEGAPLIINGENAGKISYRNPALWEEGYGPKPKPKTNLFGEPIAEAMEDEEMGDLSDLVLRLSVDVSLAGDHIWKHVSESTWEFQVNDHQKIIVINWGDGWGEKPWEVRTLFDEMTLNIFHENEQEVLDLLEKEGYLPGGSMHRREMKFHGYQESLDDEDFKEVSLSDPSGLVRVSNDRWWRYGAEATWEFVPNPEWFLTTDCAGRLSIGTPRRKHAPMEIDEQIIRDMLIGVTSMAQRFGVRSVVYVKFNPEVDSAMEDAVTVIEAMGLIQGVSYSGRAILAMVKPSEFAEALEDEDFKEVALPGAEEELTIDQIKALEPGFFDRGNTRFFGTRKVYKYKGNYVVVKNVKTHRSALPFAMPEKMTDFAIYKLQSTDQHPQGILLYKGSASDLQTAKEMIKSGDFRHPIERYRQMGEAMDDPDIEDVTHGLREPIQSIHVVGRNWWRRGYGGNYYRADIYVNDEKVTTLPEQGGSEQQYLWDAFDWLEQHGYIQRVRREGKFGGSVEGPQQVAQRMGFKLTYDAYTVRRERDL